MKEQIILYDFLRGCASIAVLIAAFIYGKVLHETYLFPEKYFMKKLAKGR